MTSAASEALTRRYVEQQDGLADGASQLVLAYWAASMLGSEEAEPGAVGNLRDLADIWLDRAARVVAAQRRRSAALGRTYYAQNRRLELPGEARLSPPSVPQIDLKAIRSSLWVTGPMQAVDKGAPREELASEERLKAIENSVIRQVADGGRAAIKAAREKDTAVVGFYRVVEPDPCSFCAMLASRGVMFSEESFDRSDARFVGPGSSKVHDGCRCHEIAVYTGKIGDHPPDSIPFRDAWNKRPNARPGESELNAFRRSWEGRQSA